MKDIGEVKLVGATVVSNLFPFAFHPSSGFHDYLDQKLSWLTVDARLPTAASAKRCAEERNPLSK